MGTVDNCVMEREGTLKFTNSIILLSKLLTKIEDRFLAQKLHTKILDMVLAFIEYKTVQHSGDVAQYHRKDLLNSVNNVVDYVENLIHLKKADATPLLSTQRNLLKFKLHIFQQTKTERPAVGRVSDSHLTSDVAPTPNVVNSKPSVKTKPDRSTLKPDSNKERIFNFIRKSPQVRTKEVVSEFSALSGRTVKRNLKELIDEGFLKRKTDGEAVHYSSTN